MTLRIAGHPIHPALVHFPMALLPASTACDIVASATGDPFWWQVAFWCIAAGLAAALAASTVGFVDYIAIPSEGKASAIATRHMIAVVTAASIYLARLLAGPRPAGEDPASPTILLILSLGGALVLLVGGWLGGTLVYRYGTGMENRIEER